MTHPSEQDLALYAGRDLGWIERLRVSRHVRACRLCGETVELFQEASAELSSSALDLPPGLRWDRLAEEMKGNIRVGLAAAECIAPVVDRSSRMGWRPAVAMGMATVLLGGAWWFTAPLKKLPQHTMRAAEGVVLQSTASGLELKENGSAMTLMHPRDGLRTISVSSPGLLRVRYVDGDTGQVTINNVYAD